jgi:hypothetical protein
VVCNLSVYVLIGCVRALPYIGRKITREHAFFIIMGGYMGVTSDGDPIRPLTLRDLQWIDQNESHRLILRSIHDRDISDKSKNDPLGKSVALLQTLWFAVQAIVRLIQKLHLTAIEVTTLAFVALNVLTYFFWWHKPVDVDYPIRIQVDPEELDKCDSSASLSIPQCPPPSESSQNDFNNPPDPSDPSASPVDTHWPAFVLTDAVLPRVERRQLLGPFGGATPVWVSVPGGFAREGTRTCL